MKRVALCMRGAVSKGPDRSVLMNDLYKEGDYVDYVKCYDSIVKHIIEPNKYNYIIDTFVHCWNEDLQKDIIILYKPVKFLFESNTKYNEEINRKTMKPTDFSGISQALAIKKSIELKEDYEKRNDIKYDIVILYRFDVLLWKDMLLSNYTNLDVNIYVNGQNGYTDVNGDFHFVMNNENSAQFKLLYDSATLGNPHATHYWINNYVTKHMGKKLKGDDIIPGQYQEVIRKIQNFSIDPGHLSIEKFDSYLPLWKFATEKYTRMQQHQYDDDASNWTVSYRDPVVGVFDMHNAWTEYEYLFENIDDTPNKVVLDFGCGPGRNLVKYAHRFKSIDGVDLSKINLDKAKLWISHNGLNLENFKLYHCNGSDLANVPSDKYDIVMSTICLQHICVHKIRFNYFKEFYRVLKPGGQITIQMGYGNAHPESVDYYADNVDAKGTNGLCDTRVENPSQLSTDLEKIGFTKFIFKLGNCGPYDRHTQWIYFRAIKPV